MDGVPFVLKCVMWFDKNCTYPTPASWYKEKFERRNLRECM